MLSVNVCLPKLTRFWSLRDMFIALVGQGIEQETVALPPSDWSADRPAWV